MAKAPISCCIIHGGDDPHLDATIASVEPHVEQIVVVRSTEVPGAHDDQGRIVDFAAARNRTLELATQPWCFWLDSDDLLAHGDRLDQLCRAPEGTCYLLPYEYSYDQLGRVVTRQYRERLWSRGRAAGRSRPSW